MTAITSSCPQTAGARAAEFDAPNWASLAPGEVRFSSAAEQTIAAPGTATATRSRRARSARRRPRPTTPRRPSTSSPEAPASGYTIIGASTVIGEFSTPGANDQVVARLYDENVSAGTEQLIGRQTYRPLNVGEGFTKQIFQLHPQAWNVAAGHVVKLELMVPTRPCTATRVLRRPPHRRTRCRSRTSNCACPRPTRRAAPKASCRRRCRSTCRRATRSRAT